MGWPDRVKSQMFSIPVLFGSVDMRFESYNASHNPKHWGLARPNGLRDLKTLCVNFLSYMCDNIDTIYSQIASHYDYSHSYSTITVK